MNLRLVSIAMLSLLVLLAAAMACSNNGGEILETPATDLKEDESQVTNPTPQAPGSTAPTDGRTFSMVFPQHGASLGTDRGGEYFAGQLVFSNGCLRIEAPTNNAADSRSLWSLIWPDTFTLETESGSIRVVDGHGRVAAHVGDHVRISRSPVTYQQAMARRLVEGLSESCPEPYLLVGDEVTAFDPKSEATELRLPDSDIIFHREETAMGFPGQMDALGIGEVVLDDECFRLGGTTPIVWPAGFTPHVQQGVVHIRNGAGRVIAKVGDEIVAGGGYHHIDRGACSGELFFPNRIRVLPDAEIYFPKQDGTPKAG